MALNKRMEWTEEDDQALGLRIAAARKIKGVSIDTLAKALEVSKATAGQWETGGRAIKHHDLARLCFTLEVSADALLFDRRIWPFDGIDAVKVAQLEPEDVQKFQGALLAVAAQIGVDITAVPGKYSPGKTPERFAPAHPMSYWLEQDGPANPLEQGGREPLGAEWEKRFKSKGSLQPKQGSSTGTTTSQGKPKRQPSKEKGK